MKQILGLLLLVLAIVGVGAALGMGASGAVDTFKSNERKAAEAAIIQAQAAQAQAQADAAQAAAAREWAETQAVERATPAVALSKALWALGIGLGALVLFVAAGFAGGAYLNRRANTIYPNAAGQYPIVRQAGLGWTVYHDPARQIGSGAIYRTPSWLDTVATAVAMIRGKQPTPPALGAEYPHGASEPAELQIATQVNAIGAVAAANRWPAITMQAGRHSAVAMDNATPRYPELPQVRVITDPAQTQRFQALLEAEGILE